MDTKGAIRALHANYNRVLLTLPSSCFPTEALEYRLGFTRLPHLRTQLAAISNGRTEIPTLLPQNSIPSSNCKNIYAPYTHKLPHLYPPTNSTPPPINLPSPTLNQTFDQFLSFQPEWVQLLLHTLHHDLPYPDIFNLLIDPSTHPTAVCDGSVLHSQGTFGWVLATGTPPCTLIQCSGPAFGACMDSFRAEAYGLLSLTTLLHLLSTYFHHPLPPTSLWCDNLAVVNTVNKLTNRQRPTFPNETLRPSWDILQAVCKHFTNHPDLTLQHVKGHQDQKASLQDLPFPAKLNIAADKLATEFQHVSSHVDGQGPLIPGTGCHLRINRQVIPSHQRRNLRRRRGGKALLQYIQTKHQLSSENVDQIDWESHTHAIHTFRQKSPAFIIKFLHKWLPVGRQVYRYNPTAYASRCPSCDCHEEDFKHAFCCPARHSWQSNLRRDLLKLFDSSHTNQVLQDLLLNGLHHWFRDTPQPPASPGERYNTLVESQSSIGWNQLIFGRWSQLWAHHQLEHLRRNNITITTYNHGTGWSTKIILLIWTHFHEAWIIRNQALHGHDQQTRQLARLNQAQYKIRALYKLRTQCTRFVQTRWFYRSPEEHFQREPKASHLENWIALNETRIIAHVAYNQSNQNHKQPTITDYFPTTDPAVEPPDNIIIPRFASLTNAPLTREPGGSAGDEPRAHR